MRSICLLLFFLVCLGKGSYSQTSRSFYNKIFYRGHFYDYNDLHVKGGFIRFVDSLIQGNIDSSEVGYLKLIRSCYIENYGRSDVLKLHLNDKAPSVLFRNFLIIVNHDRKEISGFNGSQFDFVRTRPRDTSFAICCVDNFRGNLMFSLIKYCNDSLKKANFISLFSANDCNQFKYGSLSLKNSGVDNGGFLNIKLSFIELFYCNENGGPYGKPVKEKERNIYLAFQRNSRQYKKVKN
jgi:hypothetical protein